MPAKFGSVRRVVWFRCKLRVHLMGSSKKRDGSCWWEAALSGRSSILYFSGLEIKQGEESKETGDRDNPDCAPEFSEGTT